MRAAIYARVSTEDQTAEQQLVECRRYLEAQGWELVAEYVETESGTLGRGDRPKLRELLRSARRRRFDVLLVWALDRLTREGVPAVIRYVQELDEVRVRLVSVREPYIDTRGPFGHVVLAIMAELGRIEAVRISERTRAGLERARRRGRQLGRPSRFEELRPQLERLVALKRTNAQIARAVDISPNTAKKYRALLEESGLELVPLDL
jgi:DNA invertase Pin-like site-specific DNA recombinase